MIKNKVDLKRYLSRDMAFYYEYSKFDRFMCRITGDPVYYIAKYIRFLRMEEYYYNTSNNCFGTLLYLYFLRKKNNIGNKMGFKIPKNCFGAGLTIYHHGEIIVNESARIGDDCKLHGGNCIGNNGLKDTAPNVGNGLNLGIGAKIIGDIILGNNVLVGANAVVTKSFEGDDITLIGLPAHKK